VVGCLLAGSTAVLPANLAVPLARLVPLRYRAGRVDAPEEP
jgi:hypothetical protein